MFMLILKEKKNREQTDNIPIKHKNLKNSTFSQKFKQKKCKRSKRITFQNFQFPPRIHNETLNSHRNPYSTPAKNFKIKPQKKNQTSKKSNLVIKTTKFTNKNANFSNKNLQRFEKE